MRNASGGYLSCPGKKDTKEAGLREALRNCSREISAFNRWNNRTIPSEWQRSTANEGF